MMQWTKTYLGGIISTAVTGSMYSEDWIAGICARETGFLFVRYAYQGLPFEKVCSLMKGDYGKRSRDATKQYNGFGF